MDISVVGGVRRSLRIAVLLAAISLLASLLTGAFTQETVATDELRVIVTAADGSTATATDAVEAVGGSVGSQLGIIGGVVATIPATSFEMLAGDSAVLSATVYTRAADFAAG